MSKLPFAWMSVDPGDRYVGVTAWRGTTPTACYETDPEGLVNTLELMCNGPIIETLVVEKFELYPWLQKSMGGNEFLTSQLIGVCKYLAHRGNVRFVGQLARIGKSTYRTDWYQSISPKEKRLMPWWGKLTNGDHAKDSWAHGMYYIKSQEGRWVYEYLDE